MGGIVECGVSVDTKASPRHVAIEKAQEELRQEYDVREERRRELEFLEKGGNPLDFKLSHVASLSVQSTSLTDQIAEQNVMSEAKGSVACAASPHGDSVESSGKPGSSLCRETNTADNLMLLDGENSNIGGEKIVKCGTKRTNATQPEQSVHTDGKNTAKEAEDSGLLRVGVKSQAYARRNRSKSSRESANIACIRSPGVLVDSQRKDAKGVTREPQAEDHGVSSISNSKLTSSNCNSMPKKAASDDQVAMEIEGIQTIHEDNEALKNEAGEGENEKKAPERPSSIVDNNQQLNGGGGMAAGGASAESPDAMTKLQSSLFTCNETSRETCAPEKADNGHSDRSMVDVHADDLDNKSAIPHCAVEAPSYNKHEMNLPCVDINRTTNEHPEGNENVALVKGDGRSDEDPHSLKPFDKDVKESGQLEDVSIPIIEDKSNSMHRQVSNDVHVKDEMEVCGGKGDTRKDTGQLASSNHEKVNNKASLDLERRNNSSGDSSSVDKLVSVTGACALPTKDAPNSVPSVKPFTHNLENEIQKSGGNQTKMAKKEYEDSILRKARLIEINLKRASERSLCNISLEKRQKCHWDFVLEEMSWMANDFMQERLWKSTAAAQVCHWIASGGLAKFEEATCQRKQKTVARNLAKAIMDFWRSAQTLRTSGETVMQECYSNMLEETKLVGVKANKEQGSETLEEEKCRRPRQSPIQNYALRFLEYNCNVSECIVLAEAPSTPDRLNDFGILKVPHHLSEESLFYTVAPGAMLAYRESVECLFVYHKKVCNTGRENDCEASMCDSIADVPRDNAYEADEGETSTYLLAGTYDGGLSSKLGHRKKRLMQQRMNGTRLYEVGSDVPYEPCLESKPGNQSLLSNGKRHSTFLAIPTKRIRTASRQRVVSPFPAAIVGTHQVTSKTDVSSGDTNSYQDDQSSLHGGSLPRKNVDIESTVDFDRKWPYDGSEASTKYKKKKKPKHPVYKTQQSAVDACALMAAVKVAAYDQRPKVDLIAQYDQKDYLKKRSESQQFDSNVVNGQHASKKPKLMKQAPDILQEALTPVGPVASPVASQMSNMANPSKIIKIITNRDRGRKSKAPKMGAGHSGSGSPWSNFEDQALVVLVHDMGQNWELVSDAMNSIVQFKCIYRKPKECKDRHKFLMDKSSGDGADSADDSGSSQHYQSILPGIPKKHRKMLNCTPCAYQGSARQLFQRLRGPFEEETLKAHFEKIIFLGQHLHSTRKQGDSQEHKQNTPAHSSHVVVLSQACPNNLSGGILMPLDLCDAIASNTDALSLGYPGSHTNGLTLPNYHGSIGTVLPTSNLNSRLPGSPGILGSNLPSSSTLNTPSRDAQRFGAPRPTSLQGDEQQRIQYNQMLSGRNPQQPGVSVPGALPAGVDRGVRMMPCAHGMGMLTGLNRGMPVAKPGFTRINSPGMLNMVSSGNVLPNSGPGMQNAVNVHPGAISGPGTSMLRPREPTQMLRPGQNLEEHRQMMMQEFQMQVSQANSQAVHFSSMNPPFSNAAVSPVQSFPVQQPQQTHQMPQQPHMFGNSHIQGTNHSSPQQQAYAMRLAKERHIQQCMMSQQQHPFSGASVVPTVQNGSQIQPQSQSPAATVVSTQPQHKQQHSTQNPPDGSALPNQPAGTPQHKQKKQQSQQQSRQNQQQKNQGSQQAKLMKSLGRGNMSMHQSHPVDSTQASSNSATSKNQVFDKNQMQQGPGLFPGSKGFIPSVPQPGNQAKIYNSPLAQSPTQSPDIGNQGAVQGSPSQTLLASQQSPLPSSSPLATQQQQQQRYINSSQNNIQRMMMQQNRQMNSDGRTESHIDHVQHNQMIPTTSIPQSTDSGSPGVSSINQRKQEPSHDPAAASSTSLLASSPQDTFVGNETSLTSTSQGMLQRQIPGGVPMHGHGIGSQWQQQQSRQQQPQHQQRPVVQGTVYAHPSNSGPG